MLGYGFINTNSLLAKLRFSFCSQATQRLFDVNLHLVLFLNPQSEILNGVVASILIGGRVILINHVI